MYNFTAASTLKREGEAGAATDEVKSRRKTTQLEQPELQED
jgi:hypothetical protein